MESNMPLVSVAIITYNQKEYLRECIESILEQDYDNIEIVVSDDCSTDGTQEMLKEYDRKYPNKFVLKLSDKNQGITQNSNLAHFACSGKYIAWMGGDDLMLPEKIKKKDLWALKAVHRYAVKRGKWADAIKAFQKEKAAGGKADPLLPAIYKTEEALQLKKAGKTSEAVNLLKQAIRLNNKCAAPYYQLGRIRQEEGNFKHAIDFLTSFIELDPTAGSIVFAEIEKMYFELGKFDEVEQFYHRLHQKQPDNLEVVLGLADYFERKGDFREALSLLEDIKDPDYSNLSFILGQLNILEKLGHKDMRKATIDGFISSDRQKRILTCPDCGNISDEPRYICDKCGWVKHA